MDHFFLIVRKHCYIIVQCKIVEKREHVTPKWVPSCGRQPGWRIIPGENILCTWEGGLSTGRSSLADPLAQPAEGHAGHRRHPPYCCHGYGLGSAHRNPLPHQRMLLLKRSSRLCHIRWRSGQPGAQSLKRACLIGETELLQDDLLACGVKVR